jgi:DNA-binding NtrC family response regulator
MADQIPRILVVDDEVIARDNIAYLLAKAGFATLTAGSGDEATALLEEQEVDLVLTDLRMSGGDGLALLAASKRRWPDTEVIVITGYASVDTAVAAMHAGAYHYLAKPVNVGEMLALVRKALEKRALRLEVRDLKSRVSSAAGVSRIVGCSPKTRLLRENIGQVAPLDCTVLIQGETGTGKELVAKTIHELSGRAKGRFVAFNCGAFTEELITNELFGHEKGAFTGAMQVKKGLLELAEGGTVFFDEIGELSLQMQVKLLRVLQERAVMRVGGNVEIPINIRVLAATNKDLKKEVEQGAFRLDLFYRLDVFTIKVPPLAERREDIALLAGHFLAKHSAGGTVVPQISPEALQLLADYEYPGNIRELENIVQRMLLNCSGGVITGACLEQDLRPAVILPRRPAKRNWPSLEEHEKNYILEVLDEVEGNKSKAAKILAIDRVSLWRKMKRYGVNGSED